MGVGIADALLTTNYSELFLTANNNELERTFLTANYNELERTFFKINHRGSQRATEICLYKSGTIYISYFKFMC